MEQTKLYHSTIYRADSPKGDCSLEYPCDSLEELRDMIARSEAKAQKQGYPPQEWLIVQQKTNTIYKDGRFRSRSTKEEVIAVYGTDGIVRFEDGTEWAAVKIEANTQNL